MDSSDETLDEFLRQLAHVSEASLPRSAPPAGEVGVGLATVVREEYEIVREHARGGMGRILIARQRRMGRMVALKELITRDTEAEARFVREALITAALEHPSIVPVHDVARWPSGEVFYVMKLVSGRPLSRVIEEKRTLADRLSLLPSVLAAAEAVAYAHSRGVLHRDLKPSNVLVGEFGETLVIDWGLAKQVMDHDEPSGPHQLSPAGETQVGAVMGTPGYMAPEQAEGQSVDARADVYALGVLLYTTLSGRPPYEGRSSHEVMELMRAGPPLPLSAREPRLPAELSAIVDKAMARSPGDRYATAAELAADLRRLQTGQLVAAYRYSRWARLGRWLRRHRALVLAAGAALVAATGATAINVRRIVRERDRADFERGRAEAALALEARTNQEVIVSQARVTAGDDPTATLAWLKRLHPKSPFGKEALELAVHASGRGFASRIFPFDEVRDLAVAPDGKQVVMLDHAGRARRIRLPGGAEEPFELPVRAFALAFAADGTLALGTADGRVLVLLAGGKTRELCSGGGPVERIRWGGPLASVRFSDGVRLCREGSEPRRFEGAISLAADERRIAVGRADAVELIEGSHRMRLPFEEGAAYVALSADGAWLAAATRDGAVELWNLPGGDKTRLAHPGGDTHDLVFSNDGKQLSVTRSRSIRVYQIPSDRLQKLRGHPGDPLQLGFAPDGSWLAAGGPGGVWVWRVAPLPPPSSPDDLPAWLDAATSVVLGPDGKLR